MEVFTCFFSPEPHPSRLDLFCCCHPQCTQLFPAALLAGPRFLLAPEALAVGQLPQLMLWFP